MPAYLIVRAQITDWERYRQYTLATPGILEKFGGRFLVRGGPVVSLEGPEEDARIVVLEFPSSQRAIEFYQSPEYKEARKLREGAAEAQFIVVEGAAPP